MPSDPQAAFRAGLDQASAAMPRGLAAAPAAPWAGPNEALVLATPRLAGLADARGAFETGRALRAIARLLDAARAPDAVGRQFRDNVAAALVAHRTRRQLEPWDGEATIDMFMEMYGRIVGFDDAGFAGLRSRLLRDVRGASGAARRDSRRPRH